jgi:hypothetical protein
MVISDDTQKKIKYCKYCGESMDFQTSRCKYCGSLTEDWKTSAGAMPDGFYTYPRLQYKSIADVKEKQTGENASIVQDNLNASECGVSSAGGTVSMAGDCGISQNKKLSNGLKVFLTVVFNVVPLIGQVAGIIAALIFINTDNDRDRNSFGLSILISSIVMFVVSCAVYYLLLLAYITLRM